jgi:mono/diheme cytochrome c family protein
MKSHGFSMAATAVIMAASLAGGAFAQSAGDAASPAAAAPLTVSNGDADGAFAMLGKFSEPTGEKLYLRVCAACHMADAKGATGAGTYPSLAGNPKLAIRVYPVNVVLRGLNGMPPMGPMMTDQQVADVVNYVRTNFRNKYKDVVTAAQAKSMR